MSKIIAIANHKGGAVKTSSAYQISAYYAVRDGARVLLCDTDPQGTLSKICGQNPKTVSPSLADFIIDPSIPVDAIVRQTPIQGVFIIPASRSLRQAEHRLREEHAGIEALRRSLRPLAAAFDHVLVDCPPALDHLNMNALVAADYVAIPVGSSTTDLDELIPFLETVEEARQINNSLAIAGIFLTKHQAHTGHSKSVFEALHMAYPDHALDIFIPLSVQAKDSIAARSPLVLYSPNSAVSQAYGALAHELVKRTWPRERARRYTQELHHHA